MRKTGLFRRAINIPMLAACIIFPAATGVLAQNADAPRKPVVVTPSDADAAAARDSETVFLKAYSGTKSRSVPESKLTIRRAPINGASKHGDREGQGDELVRIPGHLSFFGGPVVQMAESHNIYLFSTGCMTPACWGDPEPFLRDFGRSEFVHVTDQYVGTTANNRYTLGASAAIPFTVSKTALTDDDVRGIVHAVASASGETGYNHIYHVFIPPGQDECIVPGVCASNVFCAYHSSVDFQDIGHVLYSVEPFADVPGCQVKPGTPNGQLIDSTNDVLSHELTETITDPDGDAWFDITSGGMLGEEIGDECVFVVIVGNALFGDPAIINVNGRTYAIQPEYNNRARACTADR